MGRRMVSVVLVLAVLVGAVIFVSMTGDRDVDAGGEKVAPISVPSVEYFRSSNEGWASKGVSFDGGSSDAFFEDFEGDAGIDRFRVGVFHRDVDLQEHGELVGTWEADHDIHLDDCGDPHGHSHEVAMADRRGAFYVCRDHLMTSIGHVDGYSIAWFSPDQIFVDQTTVGWDVNNTDLGGRQWWETAIIPAGAPDVSCIEWLPCDVGSYPEGAVVVSNRDGTVRIWSNGSEVDATWETMCHSDQYSLDPEGCESKSIRRSWAVSDNGDGTITVRFHTHHWTVPGEFPEGQFRVVFKDHSYTPLKDGPVAGFTWHWDNIRVN